MLAGSCLCGSIAYEVDADPGPIVHCHCATCRKTHGSAFSTVTSVPRERFRWVRGKHLLKGYESSPGKTRYFCTQCTSLPSAPQPTRSCCVWDGLDTAIAERPKVHIWRSDAAPWYDPKDQLREWPEGKRPDA
jgi:hypothetical protein